MPKTTIPLNLLLRLLRDRPRHTGQRKERKDGKKGVAGQKGNWGERVAGTKESAAGTKESAVIDCTYAAKS